jgi:hypothetical protein
MALAEAGIQRMVRWDLASMKVPALSILCALAVSCAPVPLPGDLRSARETCNREYPRRVGNYLPHAQCVNAAVERYALPTVSYPDLIRLQERVRAALSDKIDRRQISVSAGERRMAEADHLVAVAACGLSSPKQHSAKQPRWDRRIASYSRPVYGWFTEGFDTPDLKEAKALLDALIIA